MKIELIRENTNEHGCFGLLRVFDNRNNKLFECHTLEPVEIGVEPDRNLRIPDGDYSLCYHSPSRFDKTLHSILTPDYKMVCVYNKQVSKDRTILIHWGNTIADTRGCILLGKKQASSISHSRQTCREFYKLIKSISDIENIDIISMKIRSVNIGRSLNGVN